MFVFVCIAFVCICACFHVCLYMCGCMHAQTCVFVCVRACVRACVSACTANLLVVGLVMHHRGFILCGVANGSSSGPCHVVERSGCPGVGLPSQQKVPMHTACMHFMQHEDDQAAAQDHAIVLDLPPCHKAHQA